MTNQMNQLMQMFGGPQNFQTQFNNMQQQMAMQGINPQQKVQELRNPGKMTQEQFNRFRAMANMLTGKNM